MAEKFTKILTKYWGYPKFRPLQLEIIQSVDAGKDTLGLLPTGGGKSITFQVYSLSRDGVCLVVTPLIALMKDQVENLQKKGVKALAIHSGMSPMEIKIAMDNVVWGDYKFLYISPERISTERFRERVKNININLIAVDEAHCISQWGYDFRPSYLKIPELKEFIADVPILALTATATPKVVGDIQNKLGFKKENVLQSGFTRANLKYLVREKEDKRKYITQVIQKVKGTGIVYVRSRKTSRELAELLQRANISADYYHAGLVSKTRSQKQENWKQGKTRVIVSTNAFGMGIDKANVRFVIHFDPPDSLEAYFQEAGRAGRDGNKAAAVLLYNNADKVKLKKYVSTTFPPMDTIKRVYEALCNYLQVAEGFGKNQIFEFNLALFCESYKFQIASVYSSLKLLQRQGFIEYTDEVDSPSRVLFVASRDDLYKFQVANASFDGFIKLILRSYTGLFTGYVQIDEDLLSKRANISPDVTYKYLKQLNTNKIIDYIPRKRTPYIFFSKERLSLSRVTISKDNYDIRKDDFHKRIEAVIDYATSKNKCRSQILLSYFGETGSNRCGQCDVCQSKNTLELSQFEFDQISSQVKSFLQDPITYDELVMKLKGNQDEIMDVLRWLIDNEKIIYRIDKKLEWKE